MAKLRILSIVMLFLAFNVLTVRAAGDQDLAARVQKSLADAGFGTRVVQVQARAGRIYLSGTVGSAEEADRVLRIARSVAGDRVEWVLNIGAPAGQLSGVAGRNARVSTSDNTGLRAEIEQKLAQTGWSGKADVQVQVQGSSVTVTGLVPNKEAMGAIVSVIRSVPGVNGVSWAFRIGPKTPAGRR